MSFGEGNLHEKLDKLADTNGYLCAEVNRLQKLVEERTCRIEGSYYDELFDETCTNLSCGHAIWQNESPNYCSECGAKVTPKYSEKLRNEVEE